MRTWIVAVAVLALVAAGIVMAEVVPVAIQVSPHTIALNANCTWVTVHADIAYSVVDGATITLNGIPATVTFADDRGDLVGKFDFDVVIEGLAPGEAEMVLTGERTDGTLFSGSEVVRVK